MCYSAQVYSDYRRYMRDSGARLDIAAFTALFAHPDRVPQRSKALDALLFAPASPEEGAVKALLDASNQAQVSAWQQELFRQKRRLVQAQRSLEGKSTKRALNDERVASLKIRRLTARIRAIQTADVSPAAARIYPMWYAPIIVIEDDQLVIKPMRFHCRPAGKPASYDDRFPGCYNARRDNLTRFWKGQYGINHGVLLASAFYENVALHDLEKRPLQEEERAANVVLEFRPRELDFMHVACIWSRWVGPGGEELLSFAAITDEPPVEVSAAGHDRCIVPLKPSNVKRWLKPGGDTDACEQLLDDRERPYYEHRLAA